MLHPMTYARSVLPPRGFSYTRYCPSCCVRRAFMCGEDRSVCGCFVSRISVKLARAVDAAPTPDLNVSYSNPSLCKSSRSKSKRTTCALDPISAAKRPGPVARMKPRLAVPAAHAPVPQRCGAVRAGCCRRKCAVPASPVRMTEERWPQAFAQSQHPLPHRHARAAIDARRTGRFARNGGMTRCPVHRPARPSEWPCRVFVDGSAGLSENCALSGRKSTHRCVRIS